jgi:hypothetical protein
MFCEKLLCKFFNLMDIKLSDIIKKHCVPERLILPKSTFYNLLEWQVTPYVLRVSSVAVYTKCKFYQHFKWLVTTNLSFASAFSGWLHKMLIFPVPLIAGYIKYNHEPHNNAKAF